MPILKDDFSYAAKTYAMIATGQNYLCYVYCSYTSMAVLLLSNFQVKKLVRKLTTQVGVTRKCPCPVMATMVAISSTCRGTS